MAISKSIWLVILLLLSSIEARAQFGFHAASHFSFGGMGNESESLKPRSMSTLDLQFMPGYRMSTLLAGLLLDYRFVSQISSDVGNDIGGRSFVWGLGLVWEPSLWKFLLSYDFRARHTANSINTTYKGSGYHLMAGYEFAPNFHADFQLSKMGYNSQDVNEVEQDISNDPVGHWSFGIGISYSY
jgi:hypothetical protein